MGDNRSFAFGVTGLSAIIAVLAVAFRGAAPPTGSPSAATPAAAPAAAVRDTTSRTRAIAGYRRGRDLLDDYLGDSRPAAPLPVRVLIATIPDPFDSHLDWSYDSYLESFQRAFAQAGYVPDRFWIPGRGESVTFPGTPAPVPLHDIAPSVFLYRPTALASDTLWLLYLVPEVPTAGLHPGAFRAALAERRALEASTVAYTLAAGDTLLVAGPIFSGTSRSLRRALEEARTDSTVRHIRVVTGSATAYRNRETLTRGAPCPAARCIEFGATVHPDEAMTGSLQRLIERLGLDDAEVAVLSESATQYGADPAVEFRQDSTRQALGRTAGRRAPPRAHRYLTVPFPLNIASLRSEVDKSRPLEQAPAVLGLSPAAQTRLSLDESAKPRESPPVASRLTVPTLDVVMSSAMAQLQAHDIRAVIIKATDVRDKLLLARVLKARMRDLILITYESNALLLHPDYLASLQGMFVLTSYPLIPENQYWTSPRGDARLNLLPFANDAALGIYNATLSLVAPREPLQEFSSPAQPRSATPPVWVSVVGRGRFLPVRVDAASDSFANYLVQRPPTDTLRRTGVNAGFVDRGYLAIVVVLVSVTLALLVLALQTVGWLPGRSATLSAIGLHALREQRPMRSFFTGLMLWSATVTWLPLVLVCEAQHMLSLPFPEQGHRGTLPLWVALVTGVVVWIVGLRLVVPVMRSPARADGSDDVGMERLAIRVVAGFSLLYFVTSFAWVASLARHVMRGEPDGVLLIARVSAWSSGVSPIPLMLGFGFAFTLWTWWQLQQSVELEERGMFEHALATLEETLRDDPRVTRLSGELATGRRALMSFLPDGIAHLMAVVILVLLGAVLVRAQPPLEVLAMAAPLGAWLAGAVLLLGFLGLVTTVSWAIYRLIAVWQSMERALGDLSELPILDAFGRLPRSLAAGTRVGFIGLGGESASVHHAVLWKRLHERVEGSREAHAVWSAFTPKSAPGRLTAFAEATRAVIHGWGIARTTVTPEGKVQDADDMSPDFSSILRLTEEYVALGIFSHVEIILLNLRRLAFFLLVTLVVAVIGLSSYVFQPQAPVKQLFIVLVLASVIALFLVMTRMSRNEILSRVTGTTPGKVTWDTSFVLNLVVFGAVPLLVLLSSEFPVVRSFLFSWADPLVKAVAKL